MIPVLFWLGGQWLRLQRILRIFPNSSKVSNEAGFHSTTLEYSFWNLLMDAKQWVLLSFSCQEILSILIIWWAILMVIFLLPFLDVMSMLNYLWHPSFCFHGMLWSEGFSNFTLYQLEAVFFLQYQATVTSVICLW